MKRVYRQSSGSVLFYLSLTKWVTDHNQIIVRDLWTLRLSKLLHRLESPDRAGSGSQAPSSVEESDEDDTQNASKRAGKEVGSPKLIETIALCYMGIILLRLPVRLQELYR